MSIDEDVALLAKQSNALLMIVDVLIHTLSESGALSEKALLEDMKQIAGLPTTLSDPFRSIAFDHIISFLNQRAGTQKGHWLRAVIAGGKPTNQNDE